MAYKISYYTQDQHHMPPDHHTVIDIKTSPDLFRINRYGGHSLTKDANDWIKNNIEGGYNFGLNWEDDAAIFYFVNLDSLLLFKLKYG